jgi:hypothetical protein
MVRHLFFFQKKKQKALFCYAEGYGCPTLPRSGTTGVWGLAPKKPISQSPSLRFELRQKVILISIGVYNKLLSYLSWLLSAFPEKKQKR